MGHLDPQIAGNDDRPVGCGSSRRVRGGHDVRGAEPWREHGANEAAELLDARDPHESEVVRTCFG